MPHLAFFAKFEKGRKHFPTHRLLFWFLFSFSDYPGSHAPALQMSRPFWKLRGEDVLVGAAGLPHAGRLPEGQVRQRLRDGGGEAPRVSWLGGDPASQVRLLQAPH